MITLQPQSLLQVVFYCFIIRTAYVFVSQIIGALLPDKNHEKFLKSMKAAGITVPIQSIIDAIVEYLKEKGQARMKKRKSTKENETATKSKYV